MNYRKIYQDHHGPIPKDEEGRSFEIHHVDGNSKNNSPENLKAVSIQEHYDIHLSQGDWAACIRIAGKMRLSPEKISELAKKNAASPTHVSKNPEQMKKIQAASLASPKAFCKTGKLTAASVASPNHISKNHKQMQKMFSASVASPNHNTKQISICPHCSKEGKGPAMLGHINKCKLIFPLQFS